MFFDFAFCVDTRVTRFSFGPVFCLVLPVALQNLKTEHFDNFRGCHVSDASDASLPCFQQLNFVDLADIRELGCRYPQSISTLLLAQHRVSPTQCWINTVLGEHCY